jgi:hypothetical protein
VCSNLVGVEDDEPTRVSYARVKCVPCDEETVADQEGNMYCPKCRRGISVEWRNIPDTGRSSVDTPIDGLRLGADAPRDEQQSQRGYAFDQVDPRALLELARVMEEGKKTHAPGGWRSLSIEDHLSHAVTHIMAWRARKRSIDHLPRAFTRLMMAVAIEEMMGPDGQEE